MSQLTDTLDHIAYEIEQILGICAWLIHRHAERSAGLIESPESILEENVYLESFLLHVRVLSDFFEKTKRTQRKGVELDDALARDYGLTAAPIELAPRLRQRINQELAHLSYSRAESGGESRDWLPESMARPLLLRCREFAAHVLTNCPVTLDGDRRARYTELCNMIQAILS